MPPHSEMGKKYDKLLPSVAIRYTHSSRAKLNPIPKIAVARSKIRFESENKIRGIPPIIINISPVYKW
jgi:hypothetical protein